MKSDLVRLCGKSQARVLQQCEDALRDSHNIKDSLPSEGMSGEEIMRPLGQLSIRIALMATSKEKLGREKRVYALQEIHSVLVS